MDLSLIFGLIIALGIAVYIILDGFDLGVGILFLWDRNTEEQDTMMNSIAPFWDGNETWLILGGGALLGVFPVAYSTLLPALYIPIMFMLFSLIFRGVAFEFRFKSQRSKFIWNWAFCLGSSFAAFFQGVLLGAFVQGLKIENGVYVGSVFDWLTPFSFFTGISLIMGYALLGATWLIIKTEGQLQEKAYSAARKLMLAVCSTIVIVSIWTPLQHPGIAARWFSMPNFLILLPVPMITIFLVYGLWRALDTHKEVAPFFFTIGLFLISYVGLGVSMWPYVVPRAITLWQAAASPDSQAFILVGVGLLLPVVLAYTGYVFYVFKGKVKTPLGYH